MTSRHFRPVVRLCRRSMSRAWVPLFCMVLICIGAVNLSAQTTSATINGQITDPQGGIVSGVEVQAVNIGTGVTNTTKTNENGIYVIPALPPGPYRLVVRKEGFKEINKTNLVLHVQDTLEQNFALEVGSTSESVTVEAGGNNINTTDASVSTVVDRNFVDTMPLNGRSFQSLILLAPGVVTNTPQTSASPGYSGEFSVNGQRADSNSFTVDGVTANNIAYTSGDTGVGSSGSLEATTALGTTQALVSIDALQEFKIQTSTYSAEYGRQPGAQISFETRPGTNDWHGSAYDYLRNTVFDANNWFNDNTTPVTPKPAERQNDFGGTIGGPLSIPRLYSGKNRTFAFISYEGLRLTQPQPAAIYYVPSTQLRQSAPPALQPVLTAFPVANCTTALSPQCIDPGNELSDFLLSTSLPSSLDAVSARVDEHVAPWLNLFFRYGYDNSSATSFIQTFSRIASYDNKTSTLGGDSAISPNSSNQFRLSYSPATSSSKSVLANYGGAVPADILALSDIQAINGAVEPELNFPGYATSFETGSQSGRQHQWNVIDTFVDKLGSHSLRVGADYRRTSVTALGLNPLLVYSYSSVASVLTNSPQVRVTVSAKQYPEYTNFSLFGQDEWRLTRSVNLSLGVRWELNPAPSNRSGPDSLAVKGTLSDPSSLTLAPAGTPLYKTTYYNLAPRLGMAAVLRSAPGRELVLRAGGGVFFDTGQGVAGIFGNGGSPGTGFAKTYAANASNAFPLSPTVWNILLSSTLTPPYSGVTVMYPHFQLPYSFQWNVTMEQALGQSQSISLGYIGSNGRRLLEQTDVYPQNSLFQANGLVVFENGLSASYNSLQVQFKRTLSRGLQALAAYTWSHALDYGSQDFGYFVYQRGNSAFDVRSNFSAALSYEVPRQVGPHIVSTILSGWGSDIRFTARTAFPVTLNGNLFVDATTGSLAYSGLNIIPGISFYVNGPQYPGGRSINPAAFALPTSGSLGNAPRNFVRGFGENEFDLAIRRDLPIHEQLHLQFRAEAFNVLNHPNFGYINPSYGSATFGQATETLASSLGNLSPLYQQGGPRSLQFSVRLQF
jgi:hypothetical protein